jgi:hypothetical protein
VPPHQTKLHPCQVLSLEENQLSGPLPDFLPAPDAAGARRRRRRLLVAPAAAAALGRRHLAQASLVLDDTGAEVCGCCGLARAATAAGDGEQRRPRDAGRARPRPRASRPPTCLRPPDGCPAPPQDAADEGDDSGPALRTLSVAGNALTGALPPAWATAPQRLQVLNAERNQLGSSLPADWDLPQLLLLDLSENVLTGGRGGGARGSGLVGTRSLVSGRQKQPAAATALLPSPSTPHAAARSPPHPGSVPPSLAVQPSLVFLDAHANALDGSLDGFAGGLASGNSSLLLLDLSANKLSGTLPEALARSPALASNATVTLNGCGVGWWWGGGRGTLSADLQPRAQHPPPTPPFSFIDAAAALARPRPRLRSIPVRRVLELGNNSFSGPFPLWLLEAIPRQTQACRCLVTVDGARVGGIAVGAWLDAPPPSRRRHHAPRRRPRPAARRPPVNGPDANLACPAAGAAKPYLDALGAPERGLLDLYSFNCSAGADPGRQVDLLQALDGSQAGGGGGGGAAAPGPAPVAAPAGRAARGVGGGGRDAGAIAGEAAGARCMGSGPQHPGMSRSSCLPLWSTHPSRDSPWFLIHARPRPCRHAGAVVGSVAGTALLIGGLAYGLRRRARLRRAGWEKDALEGPPDADAGGGAGAWGRGGGGGGGWGTRVGDLDSVFGVMPAAPPAAAGGAGASAGRPAAPLPSPPRLKGPNEGVELVTAADRSA